MHDDELAAVLADRRRQSDLIGAAYEAMKPKDRRAAALAIWRCEQKGCTLLHVWRSPMGILFYQPRYTSSPGMNAESSTEAGRAKNTFDGDNHWKPTAGVLDHLRDWGKDAGLTVQCAHIPRQTIAEPDLFAVVDAGTPGNPRTVIV